jgi:hypothetical protein
MDETGRVRKIIKIDKIINVKFYIFFKKYFL